MPWVIPDTFVWKYLDISSVFPADGKVVPLPLLHLGLLEKTFKWKSSKDVFMGNRSASIHMDSGLLPSANPSVIGIKFMCRS